MTHSIQFRPTGIKEKYFLKLCVRKRFFVVDIFAASLNAESLCFPYEIFNNLGTLSALCAVLHQLGAKHKQRQPSQLLKASAASNNSSPQVIQQRRYYLTTAFLFSLTLPYLFVQFWSWQHPVRPAANAVSCRLRKTQGNKKPRTQDTSSFLITHTLNYPTSRHNQG